MFFDLEAIIYENFNICEHNIISVELANILGYFEFQKELDCSSFNREVGKLA
jgi:hypothetical protein